MSTKDNIALLETVPLFRAAGSSALRLIAAEAKTRKVRRGEILFKDQAEFDAGYVVVQGSLGSYAGEHNVPDSIVGPGSLLGEQALLSGSARSDLVVAFEDSTVMRVPRDLFLKMLKTHPEAAQQIRDHVAERLGRTMDDILQVKARLL